MKHSKVVALYTWLLYFTVTLLDQFQIQTWVEKFKESKDTHTTYFTCLSLYVWKWKELSWETFKKLFKPDLLSSLHTHTHNYLVDTQTLCVFRVWCVWMFSVLRACVGVWSMHMCIWCAFVCFLFCVCAVSVHKGVMMCVAFPFCVFVCVSLVFGMCSCLSVFLAGVCVCVRGEKYLHPLQLCDNLGYQTGSREEGERHHFLLFYIPICVCVSLPS